MPATASDLPEASFSGQQEICLNVTGEDDVMEACRNRYAPLLTDRTIAYREQHGFDHRNVALSVGVQKMVRDDKAGGDRGQRGALKQLLPRRRTREPR